MSEELIYSFLAINNVEKKSIPLTRMALESNMTEKTVEQFLRLTKAVTLLGMKVIDDIKIQMCEIVVKTRRVNWKEWKSYYKSIFTGLNKPALILARYDKNYYQIVMPQYVQNEGTYCVEDVLWSRWIDVSDIQKIDIYFYEKLNNTWKNSATLEQIYSEIEQAIRFHSSLMQHSYLSSDHERWMKNMEAIRKEYDDIEKTFREM